ncbi:MAG: hypothetical protein JWR09_1869 [Mucilaginibacter sp.]|nr:hypothetical protein [Mucilaginibacter sp.]
MTDDELTGTIVMVHPELFDDPVGRNGEIGVITVTDLSDDLVRVKFEDDQRGLYATNALLIFKPSEQIYQQLKQEAMQLTPATFKDLKNIALLLDYGTPQQQRKAMEIAQKNPVSASSALVSLEESLGISQTYKRGR